jgi:ornithine cyclodeaminase/alanine dehydrogenase
VGEPIRYLSGDDVLAAMPPVADRLELAERTMIALVADADLPPKVAVHPRPSGSFAHAMPAALRPGDPSRGDDLLGIKWVTGFPDNRAHGLPTIHAIVILSDPVTGRPRAILDGGPITALRTAAVSGIALSRFGPVAAATMGAADHTPRVTILGAGVQGQSHLEVVGFTLPGVHLTIADRHPERAEALAEIARSTAGIGSTTTAHDPDGIRAATRTSDVVISAVSFTDPAHRQSMDGSWLSPDALVVAVDYATTCAATVARDAALFLVDDRGQFLANRDAGQFDAYPDPGMTIGEALLAGTPRPPSGRVVVTHLGVGLADVVFADAIVRNAEATGIGTMLPA